MTALEQYGDDDTTVTAWTHSLEGHVARPYEAYIEIECIEAPALLSRAIATMIDRTSFWERLRAEAAGKSDPLLGPLMFSLVTQRYGVEPTAINTRLWCVCGEPNPDLAAVDHQVAELVDLLSRPDEFVELPEPSVFRL